MYSEREKWRALAVHQDTGSGLQERVRDSSGVVSGDVQDGFLRNY